MKPITAEDRTTGSPTYVPLPWHVFVEFWRVVWVGFVVTFGPYAGRGANEAQEPDDTSLDATLVHTNTGTFWPARTQGTAPGALYRSLG